jgi:osmotically-inducible protein OsmY
MTFKYAKRLGVAAAAFATVACSDGHDADRTPPVGAEGRDPATAERDYAAEREMSPRAGDAEQDPRGRDEGMAGRSDVASDRELTQRVRQALSAESEMSAQARTVEVTTEDGTVTLRGAVASEQERTKIESLARSAGATRIDNELEIDRDDTSDESGRG